MNYWAKDDPLFADGHYVEDWELKRFCELTPDVQAFVREEASRGNKITSIALTAVTLSAPPTCGLLALPNGLCFLSPLFHTGTRVFDGDQEGVILHLDSGARVYPSGYEAPLDIPQTSPCLLAADARIAT